MSKVKTIEKKVTISDDKKVAQISITIEGKEVVSASVIKGKNIEEMEVEMVDGKPLITKSVGNFYCD